MCKFSWIIMMWTAKGNVETKTNVIPNQTCFLFWTFLYFSQITLWNISLGRSCNHGISALASLFVTKNNIRVRNSLIWCVNAITMCSKIVSNVIAKFLWPITLGMGGSQLCVSTKWVYRAIRSCIIEISIMFFAIFRCRSQGWPHFSLQKWSFLIKTRPGVTNCFKSVTNRTIFVAASNDTQKPWLAADLNFATL